MHTRYIMNSDNEEEPLQGKEERAHHSHQLLAGMAAFAASRLRHDLQKQDGEQVNYGLAKDVLVGLSAAKLEGIMERHHLSKQDEALESEQNDGGYYSDDERECMGANDERYNNAWDGHNGGDPGMEYDNEYNENQYNRQEEPASSGAAWPTYGSSARGIYGEAPTGAFSGALPGPPRVRPPRLPVSRGCEADLKSLNITITES